MRTHRIHALIGALAAVTIALTGCAGNSSSSSSSSSGSAKKPASLVVTNTGGDWGTCQTKSFYDPFTAKTGIKIVSGPFLNDGQIQAMVKAKTYTQDMVYPTPNLAVGDAAKQSLEKIDYSKVDKKQLIPGTFTDYAVSIDLFSWALGYRTDKAAAAPTSWADFFDTKKFPGKRALPGDIDVPSILYMALMAEGVSPKNLLPLDIDRAIKKLNTIKSDIIWYSSGSQGQQLLQSGEASMAMLYANRVIALRDAGSPVGISWNGQLLAGDLVGVPKGDPNAAATMDLIAFVTSKDINGTFSSCATGAPSNAQSKPDPKTAPDLPTSHLNQSYVTTTSTEMATYVAKHLDDITTKFNNWRAG